jgi:uncharacterized protein YndB with AHSA1/START domain
LADVKIHEGTILASITVAAAPERVFRALTVPSELLRWWGSDALYRATSWEIDLRPGGKWRCEGKGADGSPYSVEGAFVAVDPPHRLSYTWNHSWKTGKEAPPETLVTWVLVPVAGGTLVTITHGGFVPKSDEVRGHGQGWDRVLGWLEEHVRA